MPSATPAHETAPALAVKTLLHPDAGAVAADLAERAGIGQSTARKALAALEAAGSARRVEQGTGKPALWYAATVPEPAEEGHDEPLTAAESSAAHKEVAQPQEHGEQGGAAATAPESAQDPQDEAGAARPEDCAEHDEVAQVEGDGGQEEVAARKHGDPSGGAAEVEPAFAADGSDQPAPGAVPARTRRSSVEGLTAPPVREGRLGHGELGVIVLEAFALNPGAAFTAPRLARLVGRSSGAITNQLVKLSGEGTLTQVAETPATYADARALEPA